MSKKLKVYLTLEAGRQYSQHILKSPLIEGVRWNTGAPTSDMKVKVLKDFQSNIYPIKAWVDLKTRELRITKKTTVPYNYLELNHKIEVDTPTAMYYNEGKNVVIIKEVFDENKLIVKLPDNFTGKETIKFGEGASINIPDDSLKINSYLTKTDKDYIEAAKRIGLHNYLLSFVETTEDIKELLRLDPDANIIAKIESKKGLHFVKNEFEQIKNNIRLLVARADLYIELDRPHEILGALRLIIKKDPNAIAASRLLESFKDVKSIPLCADFTDLGFLLEIGYKTFLLGDDLCQNEESLLSALGVLNIMRT
ncbi:MAG: pyruvate kinase [Promethearchaeota archaeon]